MAVVTVVVHIFIASMASFVLAKSDLKGRNILYWIVQFALLYNAYTLAIPQYLIFTKMGIIDTLARVYTAVSPLDAGGVPDEAVYGRQRTGGAA